jgi:PAS domain S-box-containing protein
MSPHPASPAALRERLPANPTLDDLRAAIAGLSSAVLVTDQHGSYVAANAAACRLTGFAEAELLRMAVPDLTADTDEGVSDVLWRAFREQGVQAGEYTLARKDGSPIVVRYEALANILPGYHASFLTRVRGRQRAR